MRRVLLAFCFVILPVLSGTPRAATPLEATLTRAKASGRLVLAFVGTDSLPMDYAVQHDVLAESMDLPVEQVGMWLGSDEAKKLGPGVHILDPDGVRLARLELARVFADGVEGLSAAVARAGRLRELKQAFAGGTLDAQALPDLATLAAEAGDVDLVDKALEGLQLQEPNRSLLRAQALWQADKNADCRAVLETLQPEALTQGTAEPALWLATVRTFEPKDDTDRQAGVQALKDLADNTAASSDVRAAALSALAPLMAPTNYQALAEIENRLFGIAPGSAWTLQMQFALLDAVETLPDATLAEGVVKRMKETDTRGSLARLAQARLGVRHTVGRTWEALRKTPPWQHTMVIAGDENAFLREVARWDSSARWPVLLADAWYCRLFTRAFAPERVYYAPALGGAPPTAADATRAAAAALGSEEFDDVTAEAAPGLLAERAADGPPACVLLDPDDGLACAAAELAAGRMQRIVPVSLPGKLADTASEPDAVAMVGAVRAAMDATGLEYASLGDDVDLVTLAADLPYRCQFTASLEPGIRATDDLLFRGRGLIPWAFSGRLVPDPTYAAYSAACSLFLPRSRALLFDTYGGSRPWSDYSLARAVAPLHDERHFEVTLVERPQLNLSEWHRACRVPFAHDTVAVNSAGGFSDWSCGTGGLGDDILHIGPTFVSYVHSHAGGQPLDPNAITGRWIALGAYGFYGALNEPYLQSFSSHGVAVALHEGGWPAAVAFRKMPGSFYWTPWRNGLLGDPLDSGVILPRLLQAVPLPLGELDEGRDLPALSPLETAAMGGDWDSVVKLAAQETEPGPRDWVLLRAALLDELQWACDAGNVDGAAAALAGYYSASKADWALPALARRVRPLADASDAAKASVVALLRSLEAETKDDGARKALTEMLAGLEGGAG